jgi:hypothetical protein
MSHGYEASVNQDGSLAVALRGVRWPLPSTLPYWQPLSETLRPSLTAAETHRANHSAGTQTRSGLPDLQTFFSRSEEINSSACSASVQSLSAPPGWPSGDASSLMPELPLHCNRQTYSQKCHRRRQNSPRGFRPLEDVRASRPNLKIAVTLKAYEWAGTVQMYGGEQISELGRVMLDEVRHSLASQFRTAVELAEQRRCARHF